MSSPRPPLEQLASQVASRRNAVATARDRAMPSVAELIGRDTEEYPWLKPDLRTAMSLAGAPQQVRDAVAQRAAQSALADKTAMAKFSTIAAGLTKPKPKTKKFDWTSPGDILRAASRYTTAGLMAPMEAFQNLQGGMLNAANKYGVIPGLNVPLPSFMATDEQEAQRAKGLGGVKETLGEFGNTVDKAFEATTLFEAINQPFSEQGTGFFMGAKISDAQAAAARDARGTTADGKAWTLGRYVAQQPVNMGLLKESDKALSAYGLVSGAVDLIGAFAMDPMNIARAASAPLNITEVTAKSRGAGAIGNAILDSRKAKAADEVSRIGQLRTAMQEADEAVAQAEGFAAKVGKGADDAAKVGFTQATETNRRLALEAEQRAAEWKSYMVKLADEAADFETIDSALGSAARRAGQAVGRVAPGLGNPDRAPDWIDTVRKSAGLVEHPKYGRQVVAPDAMKTLLSTGGQRMVELLTEIDSSTRIMALWRGKMPLKVASELAKAGTAEDVIKALGRGLEVEGGLRGVRTVSRWGGIHVGDRALAEIGPSIKAKSRLLGNAAKAGDAIIEFDKPEEAFEKVYTLLGNAKVLGAERAGLMDTLVDSLVSENVGAFHYASRGMDGRLDLAGEIKKVRKGIEEAGGVADPETLTRLTQLEDAFELTQKFGGIQNAIVQSMRNVFYSRKAADLAETALAKGKTARAQKLQSLVNEVDIEFLMKNPAKNVDGASVYVADITELSPQFSNGPVMVTQLLNNKLTLMDPDAVREVAARVSNYSRFVTNTVALGGTTQRRMPLVLLEKFQENIWRTPAILRPALGVRMLAEEAFRTAYGGSMRGVGDIAMGLMRAGRNMDALGRPIDAAIQLDRIERLIAKLEVMPGKADEIAELREEMKAAESALADGKRMLSEAMGGKRGVGHLDAIQSKFGVTEVDVVRTGNWTVVDRADPRFARRYKQGLIDELNAMAADPVVKRLAHGGLFPGDTIGRRVIGAEEATGIAEIEQWLLQGAGQKFWKEYAANRAWDPTDLDKMRGWLSAQQQNLRYNFGNSEEAMRAVATGYLRDEKLAQPDRWGRTEHGKNMREWADEYAKSDGAPAKVRYEMSLSQLRSADDPVARRAYDRYRQVTSSAFQAIYSNKSDALYRVPMFARRYADEMEAMLPKLTRSEAMRAVDNLSRMAPPQGKAAGIKSAVDRVASALGEDGFIPAAQLARMRKVAETAAGDGLLEHADELARGWALDDIKQLFFKADRENFAVDRARLLFPFGRAFAEVLTTWARIIDEDKLGTIRSFDRGIRGLRESGVFHTDEQGNEVFSFPLTGQLTKMAFGVEAPFTGRVSSLNMVGSFLPSFGPVASIPAYAIAEASPLPSSAVSMLFPYGRPKSLEDAVAPSWLAKIRSGWNRDEVEQIYGNTYFRTVQYLMASGEYPTTPAGQAQLLEDAKGKARALTFMRAGIQFLGPTAPAITYVARTEGGDMVTAKLWTEYQKMMDMSDAELEAAGYDDVDSMFMAKFGDKNLAYLVGRTTSQKTGASATDEFMDWSESNVGRYARGAHPELYGYLGPAGGEFSIGAQQTLVKRGDLENRNDNDLLATANSRIASNIYEDAVAKLDKLFPDPTPAQQAKIDQALADARNKLKAEFPGWSPESGGLEGAGSVKKKLAAAEQLAADPRLADHPTARALRDYFTVRQNVIEAAKADTGKSLNAAASRQYLDYLVSIARNLEARDPGFQRLWKDVLKREFSALAKTTGGK